ncbi:MAG: DUF6151 family protein [Pseudomonadota bacterium]
MTDIDLMCNCGQVKGTARLEQGEVGNNVVCFCEDCQSFAYYLERQDSILDAHGGTEIHQLPSAFVKLTHGQEQVRCMRLSEKGLYRWYAGCCNTPLANTASAGMPFVGLIHNFKKSENRTDDSPEIHGYVYTKYAKGELPDSVASTSKFSILVRILFKLLVWRARGYQKENPFFNSEGEPVCDPIVIAPMPNR